MAGRCVLYIEYKRDRKGEIRDKAYMHDLKSITVNDNPDQQHSFLYELESGNILQFYFHPDRVEIFANDLDGLDICVTQERTGRLIGVSS